MTKQTSVEVKFGCVEVGDGVVTKIISLESYKMQTGKKNLERSFCPDLILPVCERSKFCFKNNKFYIFLNVIKNPKFSFNNQGHGL